VTTAAAKLSSITHVGMLAPAGIRLVYSPVSASRCGRAPMAEVSSRAVVDNAAHLAGGTFDAARRDDIDGDGDANGVLDSVG